MVEPFSAGGVPGVVRGGKTKPSKNGALPKKTIKHCGFQTLALLDLTARCRRSSGEDATRVLQEPRRVGQHVVDSAASSRCSSGSRRALQRLARTRRNTCSVKVVTSGDGKVLNAWQSLVTSWDQTLSSTAGQRESCWNW